MTSHDTSGDPRLTSYTGIRRVLDLTLLVAMIGATCVIVWVFLGRSAPGPGVRRNDPPLPVDVQSLAGANLKGSLSAPVGLIVYSEFQCPYCGRFARETFPTLDSTYVETGKVLFAFRHSPIEAKHPKALKAAEASECAARQGLFWNMHDRLFAKGADLSVPALIQTAANSGVPTEEAKRCISADGSAKIRQERTSAEALALTGTPSFLLGQLQPGGLKVTAIIRGARPVEVFARAIDELLAVSARGTRSAR